MGIKINQAEEYMSHIDTCNLKNGQEKIVAKEIKKIIKKLSLKKIKNNISQSEYNLKSSREWLSWLN